MITTLRLIIPTIKGIIYFKEDVVLPNLYENKSEQATVVITIKYIIAIFNLLELYDINITINLHIDKCFFESRNNDWK